VTTTLGFRAAMNGSEQHRRLARRGRERTLSKAGWWGQATAALSRRTLRGLLAAGALACAGPVMAADSARSTPSGLPVPRYVVLKFGEVNARAGPGDDHRMLWVYKARGLPVQVIAETREWRRICDPRGNLSWVHGRTVDGKRNVLGGAPPSPIHAKPKAGSKVVAYLRSQAPAALDRCQDGWCKIKVERVSGWVAAGSVWGATDAAQCR
jgi:SH3-like domain-containing protein